MIDTQLLSQAAQFPRRQPARQHAPLVVQGAQGLPRHQHADQQKDPADPVPRLPRDDDRAEQETKRHRQHHPVGCALWSEWIRARSSTSRTDNPDRACGSQRAQRPDRARSELSFGVHTDRRTVDSPHPFRERYG